MRGLMVGLAIFAGLACIADAQAVRQSAISGNIRIPTQSGSVPAQVAIRRRDVIEGNGSNDANVGIVYEPVTGLYWWRFEFFSLPIGAGKVDWVKALAASYRLYRTDSKLVAFKIADYALGVRESSEHASSLEQAISLTMAAVDRVEDSIKDGTVSFLARIRLPDLEGRDFFFLKNSSWTPNPPYVSDVSLRDHRWRIVIDGPNKDRAVVTLDESYTVLDIQRGPR